MESSGGNTAPSQVQITNRLGQVVRVFLMSAIGMGFVSSAAALFVMTTDDPVGSGATLRGVPLYAMDVTAAAASMNVDVNRPDYQAIQISGGSTAMFRLLNPSGETPDSDYVDLGTTVKNQPLSIRYYNPTAQATGPDWLGFFAQPASAQATTFSIEPIPTTPYINTQFLRLQYLTVDDAAPKTINICVGQTTATTIYIGNDGSTYTNSALTKRTTGEPCPVIASRALKVGDVSNMYYAQDETVPVNATNEFFVHRTGGFLGKLTQGSYEFQKNGDPRSDFHDPVSVMYRGSAPSGLESDPFVIPDTIVALSDYSDLIEGVDPHVYPVCFPSAKFTHGNIGQLYYFDKDGRAYYDIMLSRPASSAKCALVVQRSLLLSSISHTSIKMPVGNTMPVADGWYIKNSREIAGTIHPDGAYQEGTNMGGSMWPTSVVPFVGTPSVNVATTFPATTIHLTGDWLGSGVPNMPFSLNLCYPQTTVRLGDTTNRGQTVYYFDRQGNAYTDIFLSKRATSTGCSQIIAGGYAPRKIVNATTTVTQDMKHGIRFLSGAYWYGNLDRNVYEPLTFSYGTFQSLPLTVMLDGAYEPVDVPTQAITVTDDTGATKTLCWGPFTNVSDYPRQAVRYYNSRGQGFSDIFLTKPVACTLPATTTGGGGIKVPLQISE